MRLLMLSMLPNYKYLHYFKRIDVIKNNGSWYFVNMVRKQIFLKVLYLIERLWFCIQSKTYKLQTEFAYNRIEELT